MVHWYKRDPDAALAGMIALTLEECGAYNIIIDLLYARNGDVPDDDSFICRHLHCRPQTWHRIKASLERHGKLTVNRGQIEAKRVANELESAKKQMLKKQVWNEKRNNNNATTLNNQSVEAHTTTTTATTTTTKKESKKEKSGDILLPDSWIANEDHYELGFKLGLDTLTIKEEVAVMRSWSLGNGEKRRNWDHVFNNWLKRKAKEKINGHGGPRPLQDDSKSISRAAGRLAEAARRGEFGFGPIPSLLPRKDDDPVLLLPKGRGT